MSRDNVVQLEAALRRAVTGEDRAIKARNDARRACYAPPVVMEVTLVVRRPQFRALWETFVHRVRTLSRLDAQIAAERAARDAGFVVLSVYDIVQQ